METASRLSDPFVCPRGTFERTEKLITYFSFLKAMTLTSSRTAKTAIFYGCLYEGESIEFAEEQMRKCAENASEKGVVVIASFFDLLWKNPRAHSMAMQICRELSRRYFPDAEKHPGD